MSRIKPPRSKQYLVVLSAGADSSRVSPQTPDRVFLYIENTGANPALLRFVDEVQGDGGDISIAAGDYRQFDNPLTTLAEAINLRSPLGTTLAIIEGLAR